MRWTVGPHRPAVYWRRRAAVLAVVLLAGLAGRAAFAGTPAGGGRSASSPAAKVAANPTATPDGSPAHPFVPTVGPGPTATGAVTGQAAQGAAGTGLTAGKPAPACADGDLRLTASTSAASYPVGSGPLLTMTVRNTSGHACHRDLGPGQREFAISSGPAHTWSSRDCTPATGSADTVLAAGQQIAYQFSWPGTRSQPACAGGRPVATAGTYRLTVRLGTLTSAPAVFTLS